MATQRIATQVLPSVPTGDNTSSRRYKVGYGEVTVKNIFNGAEDLETLFYEILQNKISTASDECYNKEAVSSHVTSVIQGGNDE